MENNKSKRLKIGFFIDTFFPMVDGVVMVVDNYARRLCKNHDVTVFTTKPRKKGYDDSKLPYKVVRCARIPLHFLDYDMPLPRLSCKFKKEVKSSNLDIVHIHSPFGVGKAGLRYARKNNLPIVATLHSQFYKDFLRETHNCKWLSKLMLKKIMKVFNSCDEYWAVNSNVAKIYHKEYGSTHLPKVHNNGTDLKPLENVDLFDLREKYKISDDEKVFLFVGRLYMLKNVDFIVRSLKILKDKGFKFKMLFVGSGPDEGKLKDLVKELDMKDEIKFAGRITDREKLAKYYALADLFLFPSLYDCSSLVQIEASSQGTPTLFIKDSATSCSVTDNVNGYLAGNSEEEYAEKILKIFGNQETYNKVCNKALEQLYVSWDDAVAKAYDDYIKLIEKKEKQKQIK